MSALEKLGLAALGGAANDLVARAAQVPYVAGNWYFSSPYATTGAGGSALTTGRTYFMPWVVTRKCTVASLAARVSTVSAGGNFVLAIYASNSATNLPVGAPLAQSAANASTAAQSAVSSPLAANVQLTPGLYWIALQADNATVIFMIAATALSYAGGLVGHSSLSLLNQASAVHVSGFYATSTYGTWPAVDGTYGTLTPYAAGLPAIMFNVTSVP